MKGSNYQRVNFYVDRSGCHLIDRSFFLSLVRSGGTSGYEREETKRYV